MSENINIGAFSEALNEKADRDINNLTTGGYIKGSSLGLPSDRYVDLTLGADQSGYTAPANGWFTIYGNFAHADGYFTVVCGVARLACNCKTGTNDYTCAITVPAKKGDIMYVGYNYSPLLSTASGTPHFRFVYAEGEQV